MHPTIAEFVSCDGRGSSPDGILEPLPVVDRHITFAATCSKSTAAILALVAMTIGNGREVNPAAHRRPGLRFPPRRTRAGRALDEAARACACRAREAKTYQDQAIEISRFRDQETGDNRTAKAVGQDFQHRRGPGQTGPGVWVHGMFTSRRWHRSGAYPDRSAALEWRHGWRPCEKSLP